MGSTIHQDLFDIWLAGVESVKPAALIRDRVQVENGSLIANNVRIDCSKYRKIIVVGAGKASGAMARAFEEQVFADLARTLPNLQLTGWINCPEGSVEPSHDYRINCFEARPAGINIPTQKAVEGTNKILELSSGAQEDELVICLISGGGSALLTAPAKGISLEDKQAVAKHVAAAGGNIEQLNTVRRALSQVKAGGLARACNARLLTLVISDVLGDDLATIASGPTFTDIAPQPAAALEAIRDLGLDHHKDLANVVSYLQTVENAKCLPATQQIDHVIIGSNQVAVTAAEHKALELGYSTQSHSEGACEGDVLEVASSEASHCLNLSKQDKPACWISGGEPTVALPPEPGLGGRNQQLALAVMMQLSEELQQGHCEFEYLSGGTDGEDGPTKAAGAWFSREVFNAGRRLGLNFDVYLARADSYHLFKKLGALIEIGPTGTNVCDLRVAIAAPKN